MLFNNWMSILRVVIVSVAAYAALILVLRAAGKRSLAKLNAFDLVVTVALGSTLATVLLTKDIALAEGVLAFAMLAGLQWAVARASVRWGGFSRLVRAEPRLLVEDGRLLEAAIEAERVTRGEIDQAIRNHGIGRIEEVAAVVLETDGSFSVIGKDGDGQLTALRTVRRD
jgi:uncharacterized membrane protein YcaP (DUF421 family)